MNCKPGDLAIITGASGTWAGIIVEVIDAPPSKRFKLPCGRWHGGASLGTWIIKLPRLLPCPTRLGNTVMSQWAVIRDCKLRPVSGLPQVEVAHDEVMA